MGFDEDLNEAMKIAVRGTIDFLAEQKWYQCPRGSLRAPVHRRDWPRL